MRKSNQILQNFFYKLNDNYILNVLYVLKLILNIPDHQKRLQEILDVDNIGISIEKFSEAIAQEIYYYEDNLKINPNYLMTNIIPGVLKDTPVVWCFIALYWAFDMKNKDQDLIVNVYNHRIGDIALKFLLFFLKMKQKEANSVCAEHKTPFYGDIAARLVRISDILPVMDAQHSDHLKKLYFPTTKTDLAINFFQVQIINPWEQNTLLVQRKESKILYKHDNENINLLINPSRMLKAGAFNDLNTTYNRLMKLYHLDLANCSTRYTLGSKRKSSKKEILPSVITPLEEELIYVDSIDPYAITSEDQIENLSKRKVYRRDMKSMSDQDEDSEDVKEYIIPNAFQQHKRNVAFSSSLAKEKLLLESDYNIPILEHLKAFMVSLNTDDKDMRIYTGFFILNVTLGCKIEDLLYLLQENIAGSLQLKNDAITVKVDSSLFAKNYNKLLAQSEDKLTFGIPIAMSALIVSLKKVFLEKEFNQVDFIEKYKEFIKSSVKHFSKSISIKHKHLYRYLAQYVLVNGRDLLTSKFATAAYSQNDTAKLAYTSSRCNATEHSSLIKDYWSELCV